MSLLWTQSMAWWTNQYEPEDYEEGLRDPDEPLKERGARYKRRVMDNHGVGPEAAQKAIQHVVKHLDDDAVWKDPSEYGFASSRRAFDNYPPHIVQRLMDPHTWKGRTEEQVDLTEPIHASQDFVRPPSVAHNLFHPGKRQPDYDEEAVGDPDYDPDWSREDEDEDPRTGGDSPGRESMHSRVYFMRRNNGRMEVVDGHHRVATNLLLGKKSMPGLVIHEHEISGRR